MLGSRKPEKVDVRIIAATNKDLEGLVKKGNFREDLFYRLNVITVNLPPLRDRGDDILLLINHFSSMFAEEHGKSVPRFSDGALEVLKGYHWPGNVRELENVIQRLVVMIEGDTIDVKDLPSLMRFSIPNHNGLGRTLAEVEQDYIQKILASVDGNKTKAADILGIDRKTLREKIKKTEESGPKK
jgi:DNA-binding NtrC family response regulator